MSSHNGEKEGGASKQENEAGFLSPPGAGRRTPLNRSLHDSHHSTGTASSNGMSPVPGSATKGNRRMSDKLASRFSTFETPKPEGQPQKVLSKSVSDRMVSSGAPLTPLSAGGGTVSPRRRSDKLSDRLSKFEKSPAPDKLSQRDALQLSPDNIGDAPLSVSSVRKRRVRASLADRIKTFDSSLRDMDTDTTQLKLLTPAEVKELVRAASGHQYLETILAYYEAGGRASSNNYEESKSAKERQRTRRTKTNAARRAAWEKHSGRGRRLISSSSTQSQNNITTTLFQEIRAKAIDWTNFEPSVYDKTDAQRKLILDVVQGNFIFSEFRATGRARTGLEALIQAFQPLELTAGEVLIQQGTPQKEFFYILAENGPMEFHRDGVSVGTAEITECFGEQALLHPVPYSAMTVSVAASSKAQQGGIGAESKKIKTVLLELSQRDYRGILSIHSKRLLREKRAALMGIDFLKDYLVEGDEDDEVIIKHLASVMIRQEFKLDQTFEALEDATFAIVQTGSMKVSNTKGNLDVTLNPGDYFGERALMALPRRNLVSTTATMTGCSDGVFFKIDRVQMEKILGPQRLQTLKDVRQLMTKTTFFKKAKLSNVKKLATKIVEEKVGGDKEKKDEFSLKVEKDAAPALYVVREGTVTVSFVDAETGKSEEKKFSAGDVVGKEQIEEVKVGGKTAYRRTGGFTATSTGDASIGVLPMEEAEAPKDTAVVTPVKKKTPQTPQAVDSATKRDSSGMLQFRNKVRDAVQSGISLEDLEKISVLGEGEYGEVWLVAVDVFKTGVPELKQQFALKTQHKVDDTRGKDAVGAIRREIEVMKQLSHPQVVDLVNTYEDEESIYMLMGLIPGGELWDRIHKEEDNGDWTSGLVEAHAKFYTMVVADTLGFMHDQGYVFRDLKPENIMIDADGYPMIVDFGFAKKCPDMTYTFVGTPNYVAPEIITNGGHNRSVDFWALGVTVYEMVAGENPFFFDGMDQVSLYDAICCEKHYPLSDDKSNELKNLIDGLLEKAPIQRLGMLAGGMQDVFQHPWFNGLDLEKIRNKTWPAPWKPIRDIDDELEGTLMEKLGFEPDEEMPLKDGLATLNLNDSQGSLGGSFASIPEMGELEDSSEHQSGDRPAGKKKKTKTKNLSSSSTDSKKGTKKKGATKKKKKKEVTADDFMFVTPTTETDANYFNVTNPKIVKTEKQKAKSMTRKSAISGALAGFLQDDDDMEYDYLKPRTKTDAKTKK